MFAFMRSVRTKCGARVEADGAIFQALWQATPRQVVIRNTLPWLRTAERGCCRVRTVPVQSCVVFPRASCTRFCPAHGATRSVPTRLDTMRLATGGPGYPCYIPPSLSPSSLLRTVHRHASLQVVAYAPCAPAHSHPRRRHFSYCYGCLDVDRITSPAGSACIDIFSFLFRRVRLARRAAESAVILRLAG